jgi:hypothetical protein
MTVTACQTPTLPVPELTRHARIIFNQLPECKARLLTRHFYGRVALSLALLVNMVVCLSGWMGALPQTWAACFVL